MRLCLEAGIAPTGMALGAAAAAEFATARRRGTRGSPRARSPAGLWGDDGSGAGAGGVPRARRGGPAAAGGVADMMRKTKIVCTLGPSTEDADVLGRLLRAGMNVARFNMAHGTHDVPRRDDRAGCARPAGRPGSPRPSSSTSRDPRSARGRRRATAAVELQTGSDSDRHRGRRPVHGGAHQPLLHGPSGPGAARHAHPDRRRAHRPRGASTCGAGRRAASCARAERSAPTRT